MAIIQSVAFDNYDDFQLLNFIFSQNLISLFRGLFNNETNLRARYAVILLQGELVDSEAQILILGHFKTSIYLVAN